MRTTQKKEIRKYLESHGKLTQDAAKNFWGCARLASRIWEINQDYFDEWIRLGKSLRELELQEIDKTMVKTASGKYVAQYFLVKDD